MPDGLELVPSMGWDPLPYGCVGLIRSADAGSDRTMGSWLVLVPWAMNDSKPWIDGNKLYPPSLKTAEDERAEIVAHIREILDQRYGDTVGERAVDKFLSEFGDG